MIFDISNHFLSFLRNEIKVSPFSEDPAIVIQDQVAVNKTRMIQVIQHPGIIRFFAPATRKAKFQMICQDTDPRKAYVLAMKVLSCLQERYDFDLPTPDGKSDPAVRVVQMNPETDIIPIGDVGNGKFQYSVNYNLTLEV